MPLQNYILEQFESGPMANYQYFIGDRASREVGVVDPAFDAGYIKDLALKSGYKIVAVLLTHGHIDHINAVEELCAGTDLPVYISRYEFKTHLSGSVNFVKTDDHEIIYIGQITINCLHTPGHSPGSQCFSLPPALLTGDTLFVDGCGRCDLPGGNITKLYHSLYDTILGLPDTSIIYPGHNYGALPYATLKELKETNPFLKAKDYNEFSSWMGYA